MNKIFITAACILMIDIAIAVAHAAGNPTTQSPTSTQQARSTDAVNLFHQYHTKYRHSGIEGRKLLEAVYAQGLPKNVDNVKK